MRVTIKSANKEIYNLRPLRSKSCSSKDRIKCNKNSSTSNHLEKGRVMMNNKMLDLPTNLLCKIQIAIIIYYQTIKRSSLHKRVEIIIYFQEVLKQLQCKIMPILIKHLTQLGLFHLHHPEYTMKKHQEMISQIKITNSFRNKKKVIINATKETLQNKTLFITLNDNPITMLSKYMKIKTLQMSNK